ncbi:MAG TPA: TAXI family TRAP transporter solute-binding subunit [Burkholderiales bacterium]|nr:TAXI family TRAP transporter solute-binding subunit [Burkholderiales bacterium]
MARILRETLLQIREVLLTWGPFVLIGVAALVGAYFLLDPAPPKRVVLATGPETSAYAAFGARYEEELKRFGIQVILRPTNGSRENLRLLHDEKTDAQLAFVQGGSTESQRAQEEAAKGAPLMSLGSVFVEPLWLFYRIDKAKAIRKDGVLTQLTELRGWKVNAGARGSGAPGMLNRVLAANLMDREDVERSNLGDTEAVVALLAGQIDAMALVSAPESPIVQMLLQTPGVRLFEIQQAEAYSRRYRFMTPVVLPRGVADIPRDVPPRDVPMIASTTSLVARESTHPALVQLFVQAASRIHSGPGWIVEAGQFPTPQNTELPVAKEAERFYRTGPPLLQRYMPFWLANLVDRMWVALFSIIAILIPLSRILPPLYQFRVRSRVFRWYRQLRQIEDRHDKRRAPAAELLGELDSLESRAARIIVPLSYTDELYALRQNINLVRERVRKAT